MIDGWWWFSSFKIRQAQFNQQILSTFANLYCSSSCAINHCWLIEILTRSQPEPNSMRFQLDMIALTNPVVAILNQCQLKTMVQFDTRTYWIEWQVHLEPDLTQHVDTSLKHYSWRQIIINDFNLTSTSLELEMVMWQGGIKSRVLLVRVDNLIPHPLTP